LDQLENPFTPAKIASPDEDDIKVLQEAVEQVELIKDRFAAEEDHELLCDASDSFVRVLNKIERTRRH